MSCRSTRAMQGVFGAAAMIAAVTLVARVVGFLRSAALGQTLGPDCLGSAYTTANAVPNVVFEVVAGGALAGAVVPLLAGAAARHDRDTVSATVRALTAWALLLLVPASLCVAIFASPITTLLTGAGAGCNSAEFHDTATAMLRIFAVQIPIYGLTVISQGTLQAHHRFVAPALAPLLSSLVVISAYAIYWQQAGPDRGDLSALSSAELAVLAWGTTLGVLAMWATQWPGLSSLKLLLVKPQLKFPAGISGRARGLALAGAATVTGQWVAFAISFRISNDRGVAGAALVYTLAWTVFLLPWAILGLPVATSAFPRFASLFDAGEDTEFGKLAATTTRAVVVAGALGAAGVVATSQPMSKLMLMGAPGSDQTRALADALVAFAPGVFGFALAGHVSRMLYARHQGRLAATLVVSGWAIGSLVGWLLSLSVARVNVVSALGVGASAGMLLAGATSLIAMRAVVGSRSTFGLGRTLLGSVLAVAVSVSAGLALVSWLPDGSIALAALDILLVSAGVVVFFSVCLLVVDRDALTSLFRRVRAGRSQVATGPFPWAG